jgi:hypothetical protein
VLPALFPLIASYKNLQSVQTISLTAEVVRLNRLLQQRQQLLEQLLVTIGNSLNSTGRLPGATKQLGWL